MYKKFFAWDHEFLIVLVRLKILSNKRIHEAIIFDEIR